MFQRTSYVSLLCAGSSKDGDSFNKVDYIPVLFLPMIEGLSRRDETLVLYVVFSLKGY